MATPEAPESMADDLVDELMPEDFDWRPVVRRHPLAAVSVAATAGFLLGHSRGREILAALGGFAADTLSERVNDLLGKQVL